MKKKSILSIVLTLALLFSMTTLAQAATTGKTVTFNGGHIYQAEKGKPGTIQVKLTNIASKKSVKIDEKALMDYIDDATVADTIISYTEDGDEITLKDLVTEGKVTTYYAKSTTVTITTKSAMSSFGFYYKGEEKTKLTAKFYSFDDYLANSTNPEKIKVYKEKPEGNWLVAPGTKLKINKPGKYLFITKDDGLISDTPVGVFCVIVTK